MNSNKNYEKIIRNLKERNREVLDRCISTNIRNLSLDYEIIEYCDLLDFLLDNDLLSYLDVAQNHTILFNTYITSLRNKKRYEKTIA